MRANVSQKMFPSLSTVGNMTKYRQETMFLQQCFLVYPELNGLQRQESDGLKRFLKMLDYKSVHDDNVSFLN